MRIAESVSHRIFERTLRPLVFRRACLFERHYHPSSPACCWTTRLTLAGSKDNDGVRGRLQYTELSGNVLGLGPTRPGRFYNFITKVDLGSGRNTR